MQFLFHHSASNDPAPELVEPAVNVIRWQTASIDNPLTYEENIVREQKHIGVQCSYAVRVNEECISAALAIEKGKKKNHSGVNGSFVPFLGAIAIHRIAKSLYSL